MFVYKNKEVYPYKTALMENVSQEKTIFGDKEIPEENRIIIPAINVDMPIVEGNSEKMLNLGVWHRPETGHPGVGNMVLTGHRVGYAFLPDDVKNATSFYNLDKLKEDDFVIIYWEGKEYDYQIYSHEIVAPDTLQIESQEGDERLTLYTCDPVGKNAQRLVYYAHPFQVNKD